MKVACYLRVSTDEQNADNQRPDIEAWIKAHPGYELTGIYSENESAWKSGHQRELSHLQDDLATGRRKYDILIVWALDRLTREGVERIFSIIDTFRQLGCRVMSVKEPWLEYGNEMTPLFIAMAGWIANFESKRRSERTLAGLETARKNGKPIGKRGPDKKKRKHTGYLLRYTTKKGTGENMKNLQMQEMNNSRSNQADILQKHSENSKGK